MPALNQLGKAVSSEAVQQTKEYPSAILAEQVVKPGAGQDELKKKKRCSSVSQKIHKSLLFNIS